MVKCFTTTEISHASVWTSQIYQSYFEQVDRAGGIYYTRWGDATIKSIGIALSVEESKVHRFSDIGYTHAPFVKQQAVRANGSTGSLLLRLALRV